MTKFNDEDRKRLLREIIDGLLGQQLIRHGLQLRTEMVVERILADFEHTPIPTGPTWWERMKVKLFGEVRPDGT